MNRERRHQEPLGERSQDIETRSHSIPAHPGHAPLSMRDRALRAAAATMVIASFGMLGLAVAETASRQLAALAFPYGLEQGEGYVLDCARALTEDRPVYGPLDEPPFTACIYPPVYYAAAAALSEVGVPAITAGRLISVAGTWIVAGVLSLIACSLAADLGAARPAGGLGAGIAAGLFLGNPFVSEWSVVARVDVMALAFSMLGLLAFLRGASGPAAAAGRRWSLAAAAVFFLLAVYTKHSAVAAPAACLSAAWILDRQLFIRMGAVLATCGLLALALAMGVTSGGFFQNLMAVTGHAWHLEKLGDIAGRLVRVNAIQLLLALVFCLLSVAPLWRGRRHARDIGSSAPPAPAWLRLVLVALLPWSLLVLLTAGKVGAWINYLLEPVAASALLAGAGIAVALQRLWRPRVLDGDRLEPGPSGSSRLVAVLMLAALPLQAARLDAHSPPEIPEASGAPQARIIRLLAEADGPVISLDPSLLLLANRVVEIEPFAMKRLAERGTWDETPFLRELRAARYVLIVLPFDLDDRWSHLMLTGGMREAIRERYVVAERMHEYRLHRPRRP